jgi:hypothetical protein
VAAIKALSSVIENSKASTLMGLEIECVALTGVPADSADYARLRTSMLEPLTSATCALQTVPRCGRPAEVQPDQHITLSRL